ncbi:XLF-domain-containing protein [Terfezia boudieri ATCC MYA-4762]|uniref:Non-homologous end-joining factor 1 n=1 Tax=Terfezia boudieri ATCC MYA-4762 TaxID=1051890 RepID=A0A3N4LC09_9PEZI|nr:XLF-domain-containing protein [Terfezia boudieri ATCC MYA-4762]
MLLNPDSHWYPLVMTAQLPVRSPPLLIQRSFTNNTYSVYLTDLTYIWGESLSRREIIQRALNEDTSIDPSEDASQMRILLEKLKEALSLRGEDDDNECIDIDIQAASSRSSMSMGTVLQLKVTYGLPEPLEPLLWTFKLQPLPQTRLTKKLLLPLISLTSLHSMEVQTLVRVIKDKDIVLEKMQDSLEDSKISVTSILGGGASRRRGLEKFDEKRWRSQILQNKAGDSSLPEKIVQSLFGMEGRRGSSTSDEGFGQEWEEVVNNFEENVKTTECEKYWWDEIEAASRSRQKKRSSRGFESDENETDSSARKVSNKSDASNRNCETSSKNSPRIDAGKGSNKGKKRSSLHSDDEDEFEVQKAPPPLRSKSAIKIKSPPPSSPLQARKAPVSGEVKSPERRLDESTTEEDDDLCIPTPKNPPRARRAKSPTPAPARSPPPNQLAKSLTPPSPLPPLRKPSFSTDSRTASRKPSNSLSGSSTPSPSSPPPLARPEAKIGGIGGKIGTIGGKKAASGESQSPYPKIPDGGEKASDGEHKNLVKSGMSLGKIGGKMGGKIGGKVGGIIGGKKTAGGDGEGAEDGEAARKVDLPARGETPKTSRENPRSDVKREVSPKRETSYDPMDEEAADRKRRQLQQELEAKQKAPAKKKRKF